MEGKIIVQREKIRAAAHTQVLGVLGAGGLDAVLGSSGTFRAFLTALSWKPPRGLP